MKKTLVALLLLIVVGGAICLALFVWQLHPWVNAGTALRLGKWQFGDYEFQVWQRRTSPLLSRSPTGSSFVAGRMTGRLSLSTSRTTTRRKSNSERRTAKWKCSVMGRTEASLICQQGAFVPAQMPRCLQRMALGTPASRQATGGCDNPNRLSRTNGDEEISHCATSP